MTRWQRAQQRLDSAAANAAGLPTRVGGHTGLLGIIDTAPRLWGDVQTHARVLTLFCDLPGRMREGDEVMCGDERAVVAGAPYRDAGLWCVPLK